MAPSFIPYTWNAAAGRFITRGGRFLSFAEVRASLDAALENASRDARAIADAYTSGSIGVGEFEREMQSLIKDTQIYSSAVASGGFAQIGARELAILEQRIGEQFAYLSNFADDLAAGVKISSGQLAARSAMYAQSARNTYDVTYRDGQRDRELTEERNIIHPGEHCAQCLELRDRGWVPIGSNPPVGERTCLHNCNCTTEYR